MREEVEAADPAVLVGAAQDAVSYDPGVLDYGQTYYWRVDEINAPPDSGVIAGDVWSFTVEPFSYALQPIAATASSSFAANMGPERTIDGSGLNELDQHSMDAMDMWTSGVGVVPAWIQYEFDQVYKLDKMWVWNSNQIIEAFMGLSVKDVVIETSEDGAEWVQLEDATRFAQAPGSPTYTANTVVDFKGVFAKHVRLTINSGYGLLPQYGISEVRFFSIPLQARQPGPASGDTTEGIDVLLKWRAGRAVAMHEVYLGTASDDLALLGSTDQANYDLSAAGIEYGRTYYWQTNEVNEAAAPTGHVGDVWSFTTPDYLVVDDFEGYNDNCDRIFFAWLDGLGHNGGENIDNCNVAPYNGNGTGSLVGNALDNNLNDGSGNGNHGTHQGTPQWVQGVAGNALQFNGSTDYVEIADAPSLDMTNAITIAAWVKANSFGDWRGFVTKGIENSPYAMQMWGDGSLRFAWNWGTAATGAVGSGLVNSQGKMPLDEWAHVAVTYEGSTLGFYLHGGLDTQETDVSLVFGTSDESLILGVDFPGGDEYFEGVMDEVRIYNRALPPGEVMFLGDLMP